MVTVLAAKVYEIPDGKPVTVAVVAPVDAYVTEVIGVFIQIDCELVPAAELSVSVLDAVTVIVPVAVIV